MSQGQVKQHGDNQMPIITADRVESTFKVGGGHGHTVGELHYQMVGLLVLQRLYADVLEEKRRLEDFYTKRELSYRLRDQLDSHDKNVDEDAAAISNIHGKSQVDENNSLFSPLYRSMSHPLTTYKQMIADGPNETVNGLLQENRELKRSNQHQQTVIEELEQELHLYRQIRPSNERPLPHFADKEIVRKLLESNRLLCIQKTLVLELGIQLEKRSREIQMLQERLDLEQFGRTQAQTQINSLLNDFVLSCLEIPQINNEIKEAFQELLSKSETLCKFGLNVAAAVHLASEDSSRIDFLRSTPSEAEVNINDISLDQALEIISRLLANEQRLRREAKHQVVEHMRKHKIATMKVKNLEETLRKCDADRRLIEDRQREEIHKLRSELDTFEKTLGHRSSYAAKAAQSARSLVELIEGQKMELEYQRDCLSTELASLQRSQDELKCKNEQFEVEIKRLSVTALEEATSNVKSTLDSLVSRCDSLQNENKTLEEQLDMLQETLKRERDIHSSTEETIRRLTQQVEAQQTELKELKAVNTSLLANKQQMEAKINALEASNRERISWEWNLRQTVEPRQGSLQVRNNYGVVAFVIL